MLEVVEDKEESPVGEESAERNEPRNPLRRGDAKSIGDRRDDRARDEERRKVDPADAAGESGGDLGHGGQGEPGLPHAAGSRQREQPDPIVGEFAGDLANFPLTTDQPGGWRRRPAPGQRGSERGSQGNLDQGGLGGPDEQRPVLRRQLEGVGQHANRVESRRGALAALQVADGAGADAGAGRQLFLAQGRAPAQPAEEATKGG